MGKKNYSKGKNQMKKKTQKLFQNNNGKEQLFIDMGRQIPEI